MAIRGIGFDYLGVTAHMPERGMSIYEAVARLTGSTADQVHASYHRHNQAFQLSQISQQELWQRVAHDLGKPELAAVIFGAALQDIPLPDKAILQLARELRAGGFKVGLLSNLASGTSWDAAMHAAGVDECFDTVLLSGDIGFTKPDPRAFELLAGRLDIKTDELIFIDDREASMAGVENLGITPIVYRGLNELRGQLAKLGVTVK